MKSRFYMRTAYRLFPRLLPDCFVRLDTALEPAFNSYDDLLLHPGVRLAERLCRRMADVDHYASLIGEASADEDEGDASIRVESLLVGHLSSCKGILDAVAITLTA